MEAKIQAKELRIGNLVGYSDQFGIYTDTIRALLPDYCHLTNHGAQFDYRGIRPIILTEKWLLGFGYEQLLNGYDDPDKIEKDDGDFQWENEYVERSPRLIRANDVFFEDDYGVKIEYVHQLQNLFFALSGEELQIKVNE